MTHFPSDKSLQGLAGRRASRAGRNSPSWGYACLLSDTPWHGTANPGGSLVVGQGHSPFCPSHGPCVFCADGYDPSGGSQPPYLQGPQLPCSQGTSGFEDDALRSFSFLISRAMASQKSINHDWGPVTGGGEPPTQLQGGCLWLGLACPLVLQHSVPLIGAEAIQTEARLLRLLPW